MEEDYVMIPGSGTKKIIRDVKKEIETAFLDYSMSVIVSRALPDVRDGLKPVHRRILYTMHAAVFSHFRKFLFSATTLPLLATISASIASHGRRFNSSGITESRLKRIRLAGAGRTLLSTGRPFFRTGVIVAEFMNGQCFGPSKAPFSVLSLTFGASTAAFCRFRRALVSFRFHT